MKTIIISLLALTFPLFASAQGQGFWNDVTLSSKLGLNIGGTAPIGLPSSIRKLNSYTLQSNPAIGINAEKPIDKRWGVLVGLYYENKGMKEDANVKNYHMAIVRGGEELEGQYTGDVTTEVNEWMLTVPVEMAFHLGNKVRLHAGPYLSWLVLKQFEGYAHNGYLRVGDPTGAKVEMGDDPSTSGSYDFSKEMRHWQWGVDVGADWQTWKHLGFFFELKWGLSGIHHSNFHTIEQTLYPIFGSAGVSYKLR
jgi:hypothetical protein